MKLNMNFISTTTSKNNNPYKSFNRQTITGKTKSNGIEYASKEINKIINKSEDGVNHRVDHPSYYQDPSGVECITVARYRDFNIGNALKYLWRAGFKTEEGISNVDKQIEDLQKAIFYIKDEINKLNNDRKS